MEKINRISDKLNEVKGHLKNDKNSFEFTAKREKIGFSFYFFYIIFY